MRFRERVTIILTAVATVALAAQPSPSMRIVLLGTGGGPAPNAQRAGPSAIVEAGGEQLFIDAGRSVVQRMAQAAVLPRDVTHVFLTHLHSDHTVGLADLWLTGWWTGRSAPLEVRGPRGTASMTQHLQEAYAGDLDLRTSEPERLRRDTAGLTGIDVAEGPVYEHGGVRVLAIAVDHGPVPTFAYRIEYAGHAVVFSGDDRKSDNLIAKAQNVDVLFHPMAGFTESELKEESPVGARRRAAMQLIGSPEDAADVFERTHCKVAVLIHAFGDAAATARVRARFHGRLEVPDDLTEVGVGDAVTFRPLQSR